MPFGLTSYGPQEQPGSEYLSDSPGMEAMQPPPGMMGSGGKKGGPSNWWMAAAAPIIAMLGSKMSGGQMSFGDAIAGLGTGFAGAKLHQQNQRRQQAFDEETSNIEVAHKVVAGLGKLSPEAMQKYPKLQELAQKYQESLADDGKISPKEAGEIIRLHALAQHDEEAATREQETSRGSEDIARTTAEKATADEAAQYQTRMTGVDRALQGEGGMGPLSNSAYESARQGRYQEEYGTVPIKVGNQTFRGTHQQALYDARSQEMRERRVEAMKIARQRVGLSQVGQSLTRDRFNYAQERDMEQRLNDTFLRMYQQEEFRDLPAEQQAAIVAQQVQGVDQMVPRPGASASQGGGRKPDYIWQNGQMVPNP